MRRSSSSWKPWGSFRTDNLTFVLSLQVSECQGKVRTYFISTVRSKMANIERDSHVGGRTGGRMTLAGVVFGLVQARNKEKMRETNGGFGLSSRPPKCWGDPWGQMTADGGGHSQAILFLLVYSVFVVCCFIQSSFKVSCKNRCKGVAVSLCSSLTVSSSACCHLTEKC